LIVCSAPLADALATVAAAAEVDGAGLAEAGAAATAALAGDAGDAGDALVLPRDAVPAPPQADNSATAARLTRVTGGRCM
jgi:hypothetical protein